VAKIKELVSNIKNCSANLVDQPGFLTPDYTELAKYCKEFLLDLGYKVINPISYKFKAKRIDDLFNLFYERLEHYHPEMTGSYRNLKRDRAVAGRFVKARAEASSISEKHALSECAEIILTVFEYEDDFNFNLPLTFEMFGQANCGWITAKAVQIMNREREAKELLMVDKMIDEYNEEYIKKHGIESIALINLVEEIEDGKKEKGSSST
jgi:hypothetical protein